MNFNPDHSKQAQELIFSRKVQMINQHPLYLNQNVVPQISENLKTIFQEINKTIELLRKLQTLLTRAPLITIYKYFIRPHLDCVDMVYNQTFNMSFRQKIKTIQYNAALAITGAIRGSSREKLYQELGLETLQQRLWYRKLCCFYKILKSQWTYLCSIIPTHSMSYRARQRNKIPAINVNLLTYPD